MSEVSKLLEESRKKLLDLTLRNTLLNYNMKRKSRLIIVDELPDVLFERLLAGDKMKLDPVPYPELDEELDEVDLKEVDEASGFPPAKKYAEKIGICVDEEVPYIDLNSDNIADNYTDNSIQTLHYPDALERMMRKRRVEANGAIQEKGTNLLYLAVGFLEWKDSASSERTLNAPLILIPVQIERGSPDPKTGVYAYTLSYTDEDLFSNISLQYKMNELGISLPEFTEGNTPENYFKEINNICENNSQLMGVRRKFALDFFHFSKLLMYLDLDPSNWPQDKNIDENPVLMELTGEIESPETGLPLEDIPENETEKMGLVMDADSSQRDAIAQVLRGKNLIIEGPPGTGKSQTIANLIAVALSEEKSVLFVAEKLVALEVVKKRLDSVGLGEFILELHSHKSNKRNFYSSLKDRIDLEVSITPEKLKQTINDIEKLQSNTSDYLKVLHTVEDVIGLTPYIIFGEVQNRGKESYLHIPSEPNLLKIDQDMLHSLSIDLDALGKYIEEDEETLHSAWMGFETTSAISLDTDLIIEQIDHLKNSYERLSKSFDEKYLRDLPQTEEFLNTLETINSMELLDNYPSAVDFEKISSIKMKKLRKLLKINEDLLLKASMLKSIDIGAFNTLDEIRDTSRTLRGFRDIGFFGKLFNKEYKNARKTFNMIYLEGGGKDPEIMSKHLDSCVNSIEEYLTMLKEFYDEGGDELLKNLKIDAIDESEILKSHDNHIFYFTQPISYLEPTHNWKSKMLTNGFTKEMLEPFYESNQENYADALKNLLTKSKMIRDSINSTYKELEKYGKIHNELFYGDHEAFDEKYKILEEKTHHKSKLSVWIDTSRLLKKIEGFNLQSLIDYAQANNLSTVIKDMIEYAYYREWAHEVLRKHSVLAQFNRQVYESSLKTFRGLDQNLGSLYAKEHALSLSKKTLPNGVNGNPSKKTEMHLIRNEVAKQKRHLPIRQTLKRASKAIRALKPCFMMSPLSVSQFVDPTQEPFDLMIMDEASQIFPEDSLGAIARAKQVVVVGDPNQLPPSNFFSSSMKDDGEEEETIATSSESILDLMLRVYPNVKRLKWHYRSQHESLIAFSNHHFYDSQLMIFPSPDRNTEQVGITRKFIPNGYYKEQQNTKEAAVIVNAISEHLLHKSTESLGVVAMNKKQADLIDRLLEEKTKEDQHIRHLLDAAIQTNRFFIKNLENVQGDEADTLFVGTTYGPDTDAKKVYQRFGPINGDHGWRRMNVLITRAKKKIIVFTSLVSNDIIPSEGNRGRMAFRNYLKYIENGTVESVAGITTGKEPDSPFEESVIRYIQSLGYVAHPQVGVAGFYIDIGVMVEGSYNYILGIECDGAGYHSSKSARDRDRIRQDILESMGWKIYRIWSTDWFKHRSEEESRLKNALEEVKNNAVIIEPNVKPVEQEIIIEDRAIEDEEDDNLEEKPSINDQPKEEKQPVDDELKAELQKFKDEVVAKKYRIDSSSLLNDRMIELLANTQPTTLEEFRMHIPKYLREKIDRNQMEYIDRIFEIIEDNI